MEKRNIRRIKEGIVVGHKMDKTAVVEVSSVYRHPKYEKVMRTSKKYLVHDGENKAKIGDIVKIMETKPISKKKFYRILEITGNTEVKRRELPKKSEKEMKKEAESDTTEV